MSLSPRSLLLAAAMATSMAAASLTAVPAFAQPAAAPVALRGKITALSGDELKVHTRNGKDVEVALAPDTAIRAVENAEPKDIAQGSYVGTAAIPQADGTLKALEVHVFPPSMAGTGDGHRPWDLGNNSTMTNGTVGNLVISNEIGRAHV